MADDKKVATSTSPRLPEPQMVLASAQWELKQLAAEIAERELDPLDEAKRPGGYFLNEQGVAIDSSGKALEGKDAKPPQDAGSK